MKYRHTQTHTHTHTQGGDFSERILEMANLRWLRLNSTELTGLPENTDRFTKLVREGGTKEEREREREAGERVEGRGKEGECAVRD